MKERPIIFSGEMVRAIIDGRKTQTRRIVKPQPTVLTNDETCKAWLNCGDSRAPRCPYGVPGDKLWVRESCFTDDARRIAIYVADGTTYVAHYKRRNSIHMPRWASRLTLEITEVRVERLQEISEADAIAEGTPDDILPVDVVRMPYPTTEAQGRYAAVWDSLHGKPHIERDDDGRQVSRHDYSWDANSWVWVIEFKRAG